ncbi:ImmA/IrrE family metallo-endopeptidase [Comamonas thiooxydans]|uniref:ImmA/IrrE family metallo-endopeptidase n=1 Tax=Comamonas thiooxydans TaxID=363952 RepID=UPI0011A81DC5|nr:ImmA/IrrE family metallo-endopeptidase [Comamonas thiooxydans]
MNTTKKGDELESAFFDFLKEEIESDRFLVKKECCRLYRQKGYFSRDRDSDIFFDVSVEVWFPDADKYTMVFLFECKNYGHSVPVNDAEEFYTKALQVGATGTKPVLVTTSALQSGTLSFCRSKHIGVVRYFWKEDLKWELRRSASVSFAPSESQADMEIMAGLTLPDYQSSVFELFMQSPKRRTNTFAEFFQDLALQGADDQALANEILNDSPARGSVVKYLSAEELERRASAALSEAGIISGYVNLKEFCSRHPTLRDVRIEYKTAPLSGHQRNTLARISFQPALIELFSEPESNAGRDRFTLAHEIGHFLLSHGAYLKSEQYDEADQPDAARGVDSDNDIRRLEYQANHFAACLLMPRDIFIDVFSVQLFNFDVRNKEQGVLYVDSQQCNLDTYFSITSRLMRAFGVSRAAVTIRLAGLGLLNDVRTEIV